MLDYQLWERLLRDALALLALSDEERVRALGGGDSRGVGELCDDFTHAGDVARAGPSRLSREQRAVLDHLDATLATIAADGDEETSEFPAVGGPGWERVRERAAEALQAFGWTHVVVRPAFEIEPGVWFGPRSENLAGLSS